jgi:hypothetical protein
LIPDSYTIQVDSLKKLCGERRLINFVIPKTGCGAVGSALRSGRRGRKFESSHPDQLIQDAIVINYSGFFLAIENVVKGGF